MLIALLDGQNYDYNLNGIFFHDLKLADPEVYMNAVGDDLGATVGNIINLFLLYYLIIPLPLVTLLHILFPLADRIHVNIFLHVHYRLN